MKKYEYLYLIGNLFQFKTILDESGNEYVLFANSKLSYIESVQDRTEFEASENHVHLVDKVKQKDVFDCLQIGKNIGQALLYCLLATYPQKQFVVFVSLRRNDSMILRFHQKWDNEEPYYDPSDFTSACDTVIMIDN